MANAHDFISGFPAGYDTYVGDEGAHISGSKGEKGDGTNAGKIPSMQEPGHLNKALISRSSC